MRPAMKPTTGLGFFRVLLYFSKYSVFLMAAMTAPSTAFWSAALDSGKGVFSLGLPSEKNSSSAERGPLVAGLAKYASLIFSST